MDGWMYGWMDGLCEYMCIHVCMYATFVILPAVIKKSKMKLGILYKDGYPV